MRRLGRLLMRGMLVLLIVVLGFASPVVYVETMCREDAVSQVSTPLAERTRSATRTLMTYPEWHIVHAYDDYAEIISRRDPHDFGYWSAITGYWRIVCDLTRASAALGEVDGETRQMIHIIGVSFTFEMLLKAAYEESIGRLVTWVRGPEQSALDQLSARQAAAYAEFLQQVPWYRYDFRADAAALRAASQGTFRDRERAIALGLEHHARAAYAGLIAQAVEAVGQDELTLEMVVADLEPRILEAADGVRLLRMTEQGALVETPRYRKLTGILFDWAQAGARFVEIAGNDQIMFTAISQRPAQEGALADLPRQGYGDTRHLFLIPVGELGGALRNLEENGLQLEHVHDY